MTFQVFIWYLAIHWVNKLDQRPTEEVYSKRVYSQCERSFFVFNNSKQNKYIFFLEINTNYLGLNRSIKHDQHYLDNITFKSVSYLKLIMVEGTLDNEEQKDMTKRVKAKGIKRSQDGMQYPVLAVPSVYSLVVTFIRPGVFKHLQSIKVWK